MSGAKEKKQKHQHVLKLERRHTHVQDAIKQRQKQSKRLDMPIVKNGQLIRKQPAKKQEASHITVQDQAVIARQM